MSIHSLQSSHAAHPLSFDGALKSEWIKLLSLRSIRWSITLLIILSWASAAMIALSASSRDLVGAENSASFLVQSVSIGSTFTVLIMGVLGALAITAEYSSGLIQTTLSTVPKRGILFFAKLLVVAALTLVAGVVAVFGGAAIAAVCIGANGTQMLLTAPVLAALAGTVAYLVLAAVLALGVGFIFRSSAAAISVVVGIYFILGVVFGLMSLTGWEWVNSAASVAPAMLGDTLSQAPIRPNIPGDLSYLGALGGLVVWSAAAVVPAWFVFAQRDAE